MWTGLWELIGKPADIGHINGLGWGTRMRQERNVTEISVPGTLLRDHLSGMS